MSSFFVFGLIKLVGNISVSAEEKSNTLNLVQLKQFYIRAASKILFSTSRNKFSGVVAHMLRAPSFTLYSTVCFFGFPQFPEVKATDVKTWS